MLSMAFHVVAGGLHPAVLIWQREVHDTTPSQPGATADAHVPPPKSAWSHASSALLVPSPQPGGMGSSPRFDEQPIVNANARTTTNRTTTAAVYNALA